MQAFVIDIDGHLFHSKYDEKNNKYILIDIDKDEIKLVNKMYKKGHRIIIHTGRSWGQYEITKIQLKKYGVKYHELVMGKPIGIYVDKDSRKSLEGL